MAMCLLISGMTVATHISQSYQSQYQRVNDNISQSQLTVLSDIVGAYPVIR